MMYQSNHKMTTTYTILDSLIWDFIASIPLRIGSIVALFVNLPKNIISSIMAFGSGVLIAALAFSLIIFHLFHVFFTIIILHISIISIIIQKIDKFYLLLFFIPKTLIYSNKFFLSN
jgi:hypothetical protein